MPIINLDEILGEPVKIVFGGKEYQMQEPDELDFLRMTKWGALADMQDLEKLGDFKDEMQGVLKRLLPDFPWDKHSLPFTAIALLITQMAERLGNQTRAAGLKGFFPEKPPETKLPETGEITIPLQPVELPDLKT